MTVDAAAAFAGDESAFADLAQRHRRELHVHCYRMLAFFDDAEDAVQETFLRAWRSRDTFDGGALFRAWLYSSWSARRSSWRSSPPSRSCRRGSARH